MNQTSFMKNPHLDGDDFFMEGNSIGVLLLHGFTATTTEVRLLAENLHQSGLTTIAPLLPGHGTHPKDLNRVKWPMWVEKTKHSYEMLLEKCQQIFVVGESMGALLALELAIQHPEINGLLLFAPAIKVKLLWTAKFISIIKPYQEKKPKDDNLPWKGYKVNPTIAAHEMYKLQKHTRMHLNKITQPTLVFTGGKDRTISSDSANIILNGIQSNFKCHIHLEESSHVILIDKELDQATKHVLSFIKQFIH
jgi:carboxylesterase